MRLEGPGKVEAITESEGKGDLLDRHGAELQLRVGILELAAQQQLVGT